MPEIIQSLVSTIVPVYNRPEMLLEAVESVLAQTYRPIEIIISDDGSTDDTPRVAQALVDRYPDTIRLVQNDNRGPGPTREAGRQQARGEYIQYLDSDDLLLPNKFTAQVRALKEHPVCGAAYGYIRVCKSDGRTEDEPSRLTGRVLPTLFPWLLVERWWNTDCPLFRRSVCDAVGPWSDLRYSQDWEYDSRVGALKTQLVHCPEFVCVERQHGAERQTGIGVWLSPHDRVRFFSLLLKHAQQAEVTVGSPQMRHFSRWVFHHARMCGAMGDASSSRYCHELACQAAGHIGLKLRLFRTMASCLGWKRLGTWICRLDGSLTDGLVRRPGATESPGVSLAGSRSLDGSFSDS